MPSRTGVLVFTLALCFSGIASAETVSIVSINSPEDHSGIGELHDTVAVAIADALSSIERYDTMSRSTIGVDEWRAEAIDDLRSETDILVLVSVTDAGDGLRVTLMLYDSSEQDPARTEFVATTASEAIARAQAAAYRYVVLQDARRSAAMATAPALVRGVRSGQLSLRATVPGLRPAAFLGSLALTPPSGIVLGLYAANAVDGDTRTLALLAPILGNRAIAPPQAPPHGVVSALAAAPLGGSGVLAGLAGDLARRTAVAVEEAAAGAASELLISTEPRGAEVRIDGRAVGRSPILVRGINAGPVTVQARDGALYASKDIELSAGLESVRLDLEPTFGRLFLFSDQAPLDGLSVEIGGIDYGRLGDGLVLDVPIGTQTVVLRSPEYFWEGAVDVPLAETARVEITPVPIGAVRYSIPEGAVAVVTAVDSASGSISPDAVPTGLTDLSSPTEIAGIGRLEVVPAGRYRVQVVGGRYIPLETEVVVERGNSYSFSPRLELTREYFERTSRTEISEIEEHLAAGSVIDEAFRDRVHSLVTALSESRYDLPEIEYRARTALGEAREILETQRIEARLTQLRTQRTGLLREAEQLGAVARRESIWRYVSLGTGIGATGLWAIFTQAGNRAYSDYLTASITEDVTRLSRAVRIWDALSYVAGSIGAAGIGVNLWLTLREPADGDVRMELYGVEREIEGLEAQL